MSELVELANEMKLDFLISKNSCAVIKEKGLLRWEVYFCNKLMGEFPKRNDAISKVVDLGFGEYNVKRVKRKYSLKIVLRKNDKNWIEVYRRENLIGTQL